MDELQRLAGQVARSLNLSAETVADYAKSDDALKELAEAFKTNRTKIDSDGYARAEGKVKAEVEKALKSRGVEAPSFDKLAENLDALTQAAKATDPATLSDEDALKLPAVRRALTDAENEKMRAVTAARKEADTELETKRQAFAKEQLDAKVEAQARAVITELNPNLNPDSAKAQRQIARLVTELKSGHYKPEPDGALAPVDAEGKYLDNGAGGSKSFAEHVREVVTSEYDLPASTPRDAPGHGTQPQKDATALLHYKGDAPKTREEAVAAIVASQSNPEAVAELGELLTTLTT